MPAKVSREELLDALRELAADVDGTPTRQQMNDHGRYSRSPYDTEFGGWNAALDAAGLGTNKATDLTDDDLCADIQRVADELGEAPTMREYDDHGAYSVKPFKTHFGTWNDALRAAGLSVNKPHDIEYPSLTCEWCGDDYEVKPSKADGSRFCSNECKNEAKTEWVAEKNPNPTAGERVTLVCEWCGDEFERKLSDETTARFCSLDCLGKHNGDVRSGKDSPRWRGGYDDYYGPMWPEQRQKALERDGYACTECGATHDLVVHHMTPFREFVDGEERDYQAAHALSNLRSLCRECHAKIENPNRG